MCAEPFVAGRRERWGPDLAVPQRHVAPLMMMQPESWRSALPSRLNTLLAWTLVLTVDTIVTVAGCAGSRGHSSSADRGRCQPRRSASFTVTMHDVARPREGRSPGCFACWAYEYLRALARRGQRASGSEGRASGAAGRAILHKRLIEALTRWRRATHVHVVARAQFRWTSSPGAASLGRTRTALGPRSTPWHRSPGRRASGGAHRSPSKVP